MPIPSLARAAYLLRRFGVTTEDADIADVLEHIQATHYMADRGRCAGCEDPAPVWPCPRFVYGQHLVVQFIGRAADRQVAQTKARIEEHDKATWRAA